MQINLVDLVLGIRSGVLQAQMSSYKTIFTSDVPSENKDLYSTAVRFFQSLNDEQKPFVIFLVRQALCEAVSATLALLDGKWFIENQLKDFELKFDGDEDRLNGDLMEIWWAIEEGADINELRKFYERP